MSKNLLTVDRDEHGVVCTQFDTIEDLLAALGAATTALVGEAGIPVHIRTKAAALVAAIYHPDAEALQRNT